MSRLDERLKTKQELPAADTLVVIPTKTTRIARRDFLKTTAAVGGGLCIAAYVPELAARPVQKRWPGWGLGGNPVGHAGPAAARSTPEQSAAR